MTNRFDRRTFLTGLSATGLVGSLLKTFPLQAQSTGGALPKLVFVSPPGPWHVGYADLLPPSIQQGEGQTELAITPGLDLPQTLRTLGLSAAKEAVYRRSISVINGLNHTVRGRLYYDECPGVAAHAAAAMLLTGTCNFNNAGQNEGEFFATSESVDQFVARRFGVDVLGLSLPKKPYLNEPGDAFLSYKAPLTPGGRADRQIPFYSPMEALEEIQPLTAPVGTYSLQQRRRALLDAADRDIQSIRGSVTEFDRERLDLHVGRLTELRDSLEPPPEAVNCGNGLAVANHDLDDPTTHYDFMMDHSRVLVEALACGFTRVGYLQWGQLTGGGHRIRFPQFDVTSHVSHGPSGYDADVTWHGMAHLAAGRGGAATGFVDEEGAVPQEIRQIARPQAIGANQATNTHLAEFLYMLDQTPDVDGSSLLDNTLVVQFRPMGVNHETARISWVAAGGANLGVRQGRFLRLPSANDGQRSLKHNHDMLSAICNAMGLNDVNEYGISSFNSGAIPL